MPARVARVARVAPTASRAWALLVGSAVLEALNAMNLRPTVRVLGIPDEFQEHATAESVHARAGIDAPAIRTVLAELGVDVPIEV